MAMVTGAAATIGGVMLAASSVNNRCQPASGPNATENAAVTTTCDGVASLGDPFGNVINQVFGIGMVAAGIALMVAGVVMSNDDPPAEPKPVAIVRPMQQVATPAPPTTLAANAAINSRVENRLAIQASLVAHSGQCAAAKVTANRLAAIDPPLFQALISRDIDLARCYGQ